MKRLALTTILVCFLFSCATIPPPPPVPEQQRLKCVILPLKDLTGNYDVISPKMEDCVVSEMKTGYTFYPRQSTPNMPASYESTLYLTNMLTSEYITQEVDSPEFTDEIALISKSHNADITLLGTVEQIVYGQPSDIDGYLTYREAFGSLLGSTIAKEEVRGIRAALVEYRFNVYRVSDGTLLGTFVALGFYQLPVIDRQRIIGKANQVAAQNLLTQMNSKIPQLLGRKPQEYLKPGRHYSKTP